MSDAYHGAVCTALNGPAGLRLERLPRRALAAGEVRIAVKAAGVNFPDYLLTRGEYQLQLEPPFVPGMEVSGLVVEVGARVEGLSVGDAVMAAIRIGGFAEEAIAASEGVFALPPGFAFEEGAAFLVANQTAHHALINRGALKPGETVLVLGASGGVGFAAAQLATHLGATVIAVGSNEAKLDALRAAGMPHVIAAGAADLVQSVRARTHNVDLVFDPVGGPMAVEAARLLSWGGRFLIVGFASGEIPSFSANLALIKGYSILGVRAGEAARRDPRRYKTGMHALVAMASAGALRPYISHRFPLARTAEALQALADREVTGRVVIAMNEEKP